MNNAKKWMERFFVAFLMMGGLVTGSVVGLLWHYSGHLPQLTRVQDYHPSLPLKIYDREGVLLDTFAVEDRQLVDFDVVPDHVRKAFLAAEDADFYRHFGVDPFGIMRAALRNITAGRVVGGGSTITQQLAKTLFLSSERRLSRKIKELLLAVRLEQSLTKDEIFFLYLNQIYLGRGAYGIASAARNYFDKSVTELTLPEAAILAGLPAAPSRYAPHRHPAAARIRQQYVLGQMLSNDFIDRQQFEQALSETVQIVVNKPKSSRAPYLTEMVRQWVLEKYGEKGLVAGLQVWTTILDKAQQQATHAVAFSTSEIERSNGYEEPVTNLAETERSQWLEAQQNELKQNWQSQRQSWVQTVPPKALQAVSFPTELSAMALIGLKEVKALVTGRITSYHSLEVQIGEYRGLLPQAAMVPAKNSDYDDWKSLYEPYPDVEAPNSGFEVGDVVWVRLTTMPDPPTRNRAIWGDWERISKWLNNTGKQYDFFASIVDPPKVQGALVSVEPTTGDLLAIVGGRSFVASQYNRAYQAKRQVGSSFKPIVYAAALEHGYAVTDIFVDQPLRYESFWDGGMWRPGNYESNFLGPMTLLEGLTKSRNTITIQLAKELGIPLIQEYGRRLGLVSDLPNDLSLSLGSASLKPVEMAGVYAAFANSGRVPMIRFIHEVRTGAGELLYAAPTVQGGMTPWRYKDRLPEPSGIEKLFASRSDLPRDPIQMAEPFAQAISPETAYIVTNVLQSVVQRGTGFRARALQRPAAGKTGTTNDNYDSWFIGYVPQLVTAVWVGYDQARKIGAVMTGSRAAAPIWVSYMSEILEGVPKADFAIPSGVEVVKIDPITGELADPFAVKTWDAAFLKGTEPTVKKEKIRMDQEKQETDKAQMLQQLQ